MAAYPGTGSYGTLNTLDTLAASYQSVAKFGEDRAFEAVQKAFEAHNRIVEDMRADIMDDVTDRLRRYGTPASFGMDELDEFGTPDAQKILPGSVVGFPLRKFGGALQWTRTYFTRAKASELATQVTGMMDADLVNIRRRLQMAIFNGTNFNFDDRLVDHLQNLPLPVKALVNADGAPLPVGPNGEVFNAATHTHYLVCATPGTPADSDLQALLNTVLEHYAEGEAYMFINQAQESMVRGMPASSFTALVDIVRTVPTITTTYGREPLDVISIYNREIGIYRGARVWVKPWIPAGYVFVFLKGQPKAVVFRKDEDLPSDLVLVAENEQWPLRSQAYERNFGIGIWNRTNGAVLDITHATYTAPVYT